MLTERITTTNSLSTCRFRLESLVHYRWIYCYWNRFDRNLVDNINLLVSVNIQRKRPASGNVLKNTGRPYRLSIKFLSQVIHN